MNSQNPKCLYCGSAEIIKHGKQNSKQRYFCKSCNKTFTQITTQKYQRNTRRILSFLYNLLEHNFYNQTDLEKAFDLVEPYYKIARKIQFNTYYLKEYSKSRDFNVGCHNPKLLICMDEKEVTFIPLPDFDRASWMHSADANTSLGIDRVIKIIDNKGVGENNKRYNKPFVKTNTK